MPALPSSFPGRHPVAQYPLAQCRSPPLSGPTSCLVTMPGPPPSAPLSPILPRHHPPASTPCPGAWHGPGPASHRPLAPPSVRGPVPAPPRLPCSYPAAAPSNLSVRVSSMMRLLTSSRIMSVPGAALREPSPLRAPGTRPSLRRRFRSRARASLPARRRRPSPAPPSPRPPRMTSQTAPARGRRAGNGGAGNGGAGGPPRVVGHGCRAALGGTRGMDIPASRGEMWCACGLEVPRSVRFPPLPVN